MINKLSGIVLRLGQLQQELEKDPHDREAIDQHGRTRAQRLDEALDDLRAVTPDPVWLIVGADRGDGHHRLDTGAVHAYARRVVAEEDLNRYLFKTGHAILMLPVVDKPLILPHSEAQRLAWEEKEKK